MRSRADASLDQMHGDKFNTMSILYLVAWKVTAAVAIVALAVLP
jgi:hypothetical protein